MPCYSSSEAKNAYFMTSEATNEIYFLASRGAINGIFIPKEFYTFKRDRFLALNDVIHVHTLRHINDDVAKCAMSAKTETIGVGVEKEKISAVDYDRISDLFSVKIKTINIQT